MILVFQRFFHLSQIISFALTKKRHTVYLFNISLAIGGLLRDSIYFELLKKKRHKRVVFFRGWNPSFENKIENNRILRTWLHYTFLKADRIIVLSSQFQLRLREWGYKGPISLETTAVDDTLLEGVDWQNLQANRQDTHQPQLLYLGNISKAKGVWEVTQALEYLNGRDKSPHVQLTIAGGGKELNSLKENVENNNLSVHFPGYVRGKQKAEIYKQSHLFVFASYHEGMPNAVLEAMAFGLPVITTRVGGIPDFFEEGKMGFFLDNRDPEHIAEKIQYLLDRPELMKEISEYNYHYAKEHFYASKVAARLEKIIDNVAEERV